MPKINILRPATATFPNIDLTFHALVESNDKWQLADSFHTDLQFEWHLVKTDNFGNGMQIQNLGKGKSIKLRVPDNPLLYKLYLTVSRGNVITTTLATLNTPLE